MTTVPTSDLPLFQTAPSPANRPAHGTPTIQERFERFHADNPHVYNRLREMALALRQAGVERYGIKGLFEALRYERITTTGEPWTLNNNYTAYYARLLMEMEPALAGFFETRERRSW